MTRKVLVLLVAALMAQGCTAISEAAARVNGEKVTQASVETELDALRAAENVREAIRQQGPELLGQARQFILSDLIVEAVKRQQGRKLGITVTERDVDAFIREQEQAAGGRAQLQRALEQQNITPERLRIISRRLVLDQKLPRAVTKDLKVDEAAVRQAYDARKDAFTEYHLRQIVLPSQEDAQATFEELRAGADFQAVAEARSTSDQVDLDWVQAGQVAQFEQQLQTAPDGGLVGPLPADEQTGSFVIFQVVGRRPTPFEQVREQLADLLVESQRKERYSSWLERHVQRADIVVNPKYGRIDRKAMLDLAQQLTSTQPFSLDFVQPDTALVR